MAHITFAGVTDEVRDLVTDFIDRLEAAGHKGSIVAEQPAPVIDPLAAIEDLGTVPDAVFTGLGITREEVERGRRAHPAVDVNAHHAAAPAP